MKKSTKCLFALLLMLGAMLEMKAADVYLLTAQTINGIVGNYEVPSNHQLAPNTSYGDNVYSLKITSMPETGFWFRIGVSGGGNQMQPKVDGDQLKINEEGTQNPTSYSIESDCYGSSNAWKVSYTADEYEYLTVNVDITNGSTRRVWIEGKKTSAGGSGEPVVWSTTDVEPGYYLVGNFFSPYNRGGEYNPGGDGEKIDYENMCISNSKSKKTRAMRSASRHASRHMHRFLLLTSMTIRWFTDRARYSTCMAQRVIPAHCRQQTELWELFVEQQRQRHLSVLRH